MISGSGYTRHAPASGQSAARRTVIRISRNTDKIPGNVVGSIYVYWQKQLKGLTKNSVNDENFWAGI